MLMRASLPRSKLLTSGWCALSVVTKYACLNPCSSMCCSNACQISALIFISSVSAGEKPRSSKRSPLVTCPGLLLWFALFMSPLLQNPLLHLRQPARGGIEILALGLGGVFFKAVQHIDGVFDTRQVHHSVPGLFVRVFQLENSRADRLHRPYLQPRRPSVLHFPQRVAEIPLHRLRPRLQNFPRIAFPGDRSHFRFFRRRHVFNFIVSVL